MSRSNSSRIDHTISSIYSLLPPPPGHGFTSMSMHGPCRTSVVIPNCDGVIAVFLSGRKSEAVGGPLGVSRISGRVGLKLRSVSHGGLCEVMGHLCNTSVVWTCFPRDPSTVPSQKVIGDTVV